MRMTKEQLLIAARTAAKYLPAASADIMNELANRLDVTSVALSEALEQRKALAADNKYLLDLAARELSTSWLHNRAMLGMQAAMLCLSQGDIKAARDWLEGTTDEAVAEMPDDMTPDGLQAWYDGNMTSNDGGNGFLTHEEALEKLRQRAPATDAAIAALRAEGVRPRIQERDLKALLRFNETCEDGEGYDIGIDAMNRLVEIGLCGKGYGGIRHITPFGQWVIDAQEGEIDSTPLRTESDVNADFSEHLARQLRESKGEVQS